MEDDVIKTQLGFWLNRTAPETSIRELPDKLIAIGSDVGINRQENQDRAVVLRAQVTKNRYFYVGVLCDGMGGMESGSGCATLAVTSFLASCLLNRTLKPSARLEKAVLDANKDVYSKYNGSGGSTLSAFIVDSDGSFEAVNVGDSRLYLSDGVELRQMTVDDTLAGQLKRSGHGHADNKLLQFVGMGDEIEPHMLELPDPLGMKRMILTTDGIHYLPEEVLKGILLQDEAAYELAERYIKTARWCSGHDNGSLIILNNLVDIISQKEGGLEENAAMPSGTVQFWDCNGDVQFIGVKLKSTVEDNFPSSTSPKKVDMAHNIIESENKKKESLSDSVIEEKNLKKTKAVNKKDKKPQLRIDFDERE